MNAHTQFPIVLTAAQRAAREAASQAATLDQLANLQKRIEDMTRLVKRTSYYWDAPEYAAFLNGVHDITGIDAVYDAAQEIEGDTDPDEAFWNEADYRYEQRRDDEMMRKWEGGQ